MLKNYKKGFTLIELLVVIAIIGILSSVVLASLNSARTKGADAAVKDNLDNIRSQAQIYYDNQIPNGYGDDVADCAGGMFAGDTVVNNAISAAQSASGGSPICASDDGDPAAGSVATSWAIAIPLKTDPTKSWCVDSTGAGKEEITSGLSLVTGDVAVCP